MARAASNGRFAIFGDVIAGQDDYHNARLGAFDGACKLNAVSARKLYVHEYKVGFEPVYHVHGFIAVGGFFDFRGGKPHREHLFKGAAKYEIVFNNKNGTHLFTPPEPIRDRPDAFSPGLRPGSGVFTIPTYGHIRSVMGKYIAYSNFGISSTVYLPGTADAAWTGNVKKTTDFGWIIVFSLED